MYVCVCVFASVVLYLRARAAWRAGRRVRWWMRRQESPRPAKKKQLGAQNKTAAPPIARRGRAAWKPASQPAPPSMPYPFGAGSRSCACWKGSKAKRHSFLCKKDGGSLNMDLETIARRQPDRLPGVGGTAWRYTPTYLTDSCIYSSSGPSPRTQTHKCSATTTPQSNTVGKQKSKKERHHRDCEPPPIPYRNGSAVLEKG